MEGWEARCAMHPRSWLTNTHQDIDAAPGPRRSIRTRTKAAPTYNNSAGSSRVKFDLPSESPSPIKPSSQIQQHRKVQVMHQFDSLWDTYSNGGEQSLGGGMGASRPRTVVDHSLSSLDLTLSLSPARETRFAASRNAWASPPTKSPEKVRGQVQAARARAAEQAAEKVEKAAAKRERRARREERAAQARLAGETQRATQRVGRARRLAAEAAEFERTHTRMCSSPLKTRAVKDIEAWGHAQPGEWARGGGPGRPPKKGKESPSPFLAGGTRWTPPPPQRPVGRAAGEAWSARSDDDDDAAAAVAAAAAAAAASAVPARNDNGDFEDDGDGDDDDDGGVIEDDAWGDGNHGGGGGGGGGGGARVDRTRLGDASGALQYTANDATDEIQMEEKLILSVDHNAAASIQARMGRGVQGRRLAA